jgi:uncharacterized protein (DUF488 family)
MNQPDPLTVFTIGHSTHEYERFHALLRGAGVTALADVRTAPFSRHQPHFNADTLKAELRRDAIAYSFLGKELGGRPSGRQYYCDGVADYEKMATASEFTLGLDRVIEGAQKYRIALMCSEQDPLDCHRCLLAGRALAQRGIIVRHILSDGQMATQPEIEIQLLELSGHSHEDLLATREERLTLAYRARSRKVAFAETASGADSAVAAE